MNYLDNGTYTCKAFNHPQYYTEATSSLTVECKGLFIKFVALSFCVYCRHSGHATVTTCCLCHVGTHVTLWCIARGLSSPRIQWFQNNKPVRHYAEPYVQSFVVPTNYSHRTTYTCFGRNFTENMDCPRKNITVIVQGIHIVYIATVCTTIIIYIIARCGSFPSLPNARIQCIGYNYCQSVVIMCNSGYVLKGLWLLRCNGGRWPDLPTCEKVP